jgi:hypothetical protein
MTNWKTSDFVLKNIMKIRIEKSLLFQCKKWKKIGRETS